MSFSASSSLERIGKYAFRETDLIDVAIPDSVKEIDDWCFSGCRRLSHVSFSASSSLERIGKYAFRETDLSGVTIPDSVKEIDDWCFSACARLSQVNWSGSTQLEYVGEGAFEGTSINYDDISGMKTRLVGDGKDGCLLV